MPKALENVRVLDLGRILAAPTTSMILGDLGAEIIHVEPPWGDDSRTFGPFVDGKSAYYVSINRNKKGIVLDLKKPEAREIVHDLIAVSDVLLENFRVGTMERLGFSYERAHAINPRIIYASISGFGNDALPEYANRPAYDLVAQAFSGLMSITGTEGGPPVRVGSSIGDVMAGHHCAIAILAALWHRERTGQGQRVDIAMVDSLIYMLENAIVRYTVSGQIPHALGTRHPTIVPFQVFRTADGWLSVPIGNDELWVRYCQAIERPDLAALPRFQTNPSRVEHADELLPILEEVMATKATGEWLSILARHELPCSQINTIDQVVHDPNVNHRKMVVDLDQPDIGRLKIAGSSFHMSETPGEVREHAPLLGEHTTQVLTDLLGYAPERVAALITSGAVYQHGTSQD